MRPHLLFSFSLALAFVPATAAARPAPFDREAAAKALDRDFDGCLPDRTPVYVVVTFQPSGELDAITDAKWGATRKDPVPESVTSCIRRTLDGARVPAFTGAPVRVGKKVAFVHAGERGCAGLTVASQPWTPVLVDGLLIGPTPLDARIPEGDHELTWQEKDGKAVHRTFTFRCDRRVLLSLETGRAPRVQDTPMPPTLEAARRRNAR